MLIHAADVAVEVSRKSLDCQKYLSVSVQLGGFIKVDISMFHIFVNIFLLLLFYECIDIEYNNKINFVLNVYTYYFKTKPRTLLELSICIPRYLHIVGLKWIVKLLMGKKGMADYNLLYVLYYYFCKQQSFVLNFVVMKE